MKAALGFRIHTGWAACIVLGGPLSELQVLERTRVELATDEKAAAAYHAAQGAPPAAQKKIVEAAHKDAKKRALVEMKTLVAALAAKGYEAVATGLVLGAGRLPEDLTAILRSHALVHSAEGELFRGALREASTTLGLSVSAVPGRQLYEQAAGTFEISSDEVKRRVDELGRQVGKPWAQDQKEAALVAWLALGNAGRRT